MAVYNSLDRDLVNSKTLYSLTHFGFSPTHSWRVYLLLGSGAWQLQGASIMSPSVVSSSELWLKSTSQEIPRRVWGFLLRRSFSSHPQPTSPCPLNNTLRTWETTKEPLSECLMSHFYFTRWDWASDVLGYQGFSLHWLFNCFLGLRTLYESIIETYSLSENFKNVIIFKKAQSKIIRWLWVQTLSQTTRVYPPPPQVTQHCASAASSEK